jgi:hypothetical protein
MPRAVLAGLLAGLLLGAAGMSGCSPNHRRPCPLTESLVPSCGVLWGITTEPNTTSKLHAVERALDTRLNMVYHFHDLDDRIPSADERALVRSGRILHLAIDSRIYQPPGRTVPWSDVTAGAYDSALRRDARGIAALDRPVFVTFGHEPDKPTTSPGSPAGFVAAWRHVRALFDAAGARNAVWVWVVTGYPEHFPVIPKLWPGNNYVDWISWEAYNSSGCARGTDRTLFKTFAQSALPFLRWLLTTGARAGIDIRKPMMISEAGSTLYPGDSALTASWYRDIPLVLHRHPQIKGVDLWDRPGLDGCDFQFDDAPVVRAVIKRISASATVLGRPDG